MKKLTFIMLTLVCSMSLWALPGNGVVYVTPDGAGSKDGSSWENAMADITEALTEAVRTAGNKKDVWVAGGTYVLSGPVNLKDSVNMYGSFAGTETSVSERPQVEGAQPWEFENPTILQADGTNRVIQARGHMALDIVIDGFVFTNGGDSDNGENPVLNGKAGAVVCRGGTIWQNCIIRGNKSVVEGNGAGINMTGGSVRYCLIENNAQSIGANGGGGIFSNPASGYTSTIENCVIRGNTSTVRGAGIGLQGGQMTYIRNCVIYGNSAINGTVLQPGGGIRAQGTSNNEISNCVIYNNSGSSAVYYQSGNFYNNTIVANIGGMYIGGITANIINNVIWNCTTEDQTTPTSITGASGGPTCRVLNNYTRNPVSGENGWTISETEGVTNSNLQFPDNATNDTVWNLETNEFTGVGPCFVNPNTFSVGAGEAADLEENIEYWASLDWNLKPGSPLIDKGMALTDILTEDITGLERPQGNSWDIGAYEHPFFTVTVVTIKGNENGVVFDANDEITEGDTFLFQKGSSLNWYFLPNEGYEAYVTYTNANGEETNISESIDAANEGLCSWVITEEMNINIDFREIDSGLHSLTADDIQLSTQNNLLTIKGLNINDAISVYSVTGALVYRASASQAEVSIPLSNGIYVVRINNAVQKAIMK